MKKYIIVILIIVSNLSFAQNLWTKTDKLSERTTDTFYTLNLSQLLRQLNTTTLKGDIIIDVPTLEGKIEQFKVRSFPVVDPKVAAKYNLGSYVGYSLSNPTKTIRFSTAPTQFQSMVFVNGKYEFLEPVDGETTLYRLHPKSLKTQGNKAFECKMDEKPLSRLQLNKLYDRAQTETQKGLLQLRTSDQKYRTLRLAIAVPGEYTAYFGGVAGAMTQINATLTRVNGIFEKDLSVHLNLIDAPTLIYTDAATDPFSDAISKDNWSMELQKTLTAVVGESNYDIGHFFGASGGGGDAGCIGCVCVSPSLDANGIPTESKKGSAYTSPGDGVPKGDVFDIDYVAHEMGHQLGANHTFAHKIENTGVNIEPGSGSTIMGYAGITTANVQMHSDAYFSVASIEQISQNLVTKTCDIETPIANTPPTIAALTNYSIPKGTPFILTANATDAENDPLTYTWEQKDSALNAVTKITGLEMTGPIFRSMMPSANPTRYFPKFSNVMNGLLTSAADWESVPLVSRTLNFAVTVRDNSPQTQQSQTATAMQKITVTGDGPFKITNTNSFYINDFTNLTWNVANTTSATYNVSNVKVDYTLDNGATWISLFESTANDGSEPIQFPPSLLNKKVKIRISAINHIFYCVSNEITVLEKQQCGSLAPENFTAAMSNLDVLLNWTAYFNATYIVRYKKVVDTNWTEIPTTNNQYTITGLASDVEYEFQVAQVCNGITGNYTISSRVTIPGLKYCSLASLSSEFEYISNVKVTSGSNVADLPSTASTYSNFATDNNKTIRLSKSATSHNLNITIAYPTDEDFYETLSVWIDFNRDGYFSETERIVKAFVPDPSDGNVGTKTVSFPFTIPTDAYSGSSAVRMRIALKVGPSINSVPNNACDGVLKGSAYQSSTFKYGEVEDYKVFIDN